MNDLVSTIAIRAQILSLIFLKAQSNKQIDIVECLASQIWREYFGPMFEADILDYVIQVMQSKPAILHQINEGYPYYLIQPENDAIGYFSVRTSQREDEIQLSKLYLLSTERGKGL